VTAPPTTPVPSSEALTEVVVLTPGVVADVRWTVRMFLYRVGSFAPIV
jgi:hypothetical protein